jgi:hypothetical protein
LSGRDGILAPILRFLGLRLGKQVVIADDFSSANISVVWCSRECHPKHKFVKANALPTTHLRLEGYFRKYKGLDNIM